MKCRLCARSVFECGGYFERVNEKGVAGIWECRPACGVQLSAVDAILGAIEIPKNNLTDAPPGATVGHDENEKRGG